MLDPDHDSYVRALERRVAELERLRPLVRDMEVDIAAIIQEVRAMLLPGFLATKRADVRRKCRQGPVLSPEARLIMNRRKAAVARAAKKIGKARGDVKDAETLRRLRDQASRT